MWLDLCFSLTSFFPVLGRDMGVELENLQFKLQPSCTL